MQIDRKRLNFMLFFKTKFQNNGMNYEKGSSSNTDTRNFYSLQFIPNIELHQS